VDQDTRDGLAPHIASIRALDRFYIPTRYPDTLVGPLSEALPGQQEAKTALGVAKVTTRIAGELLGP
jgi:HEPN domain-containing protein